MIRILAISNSNKHFDNAIYEYKKRLGKNIEIINMKPVKYGTHIQIIEKETKNIINKIQSEQKIGKQRTYILLSKDGNTKTTQEFIKILNKYPHITFIIGGPYGLNETIIKENIKEKISFGSHTIPHGLVKLILIEQIYRSNMIQQGKSYHW